MNYPGSLCERKLDDGRVIVVYPLLWGMVRLVVGPDDGITITDEWHYENAELAMGAMLLWNGEGEPKVWHRHPASGRRRPKGDPEREYVRA